jgi:hypothetical protein
VRNPRPSANVSTGMPDSRAMSDAAVPAWIEAVAVVVGMIGSSVITLLTWSYRMADRLRLRDDNAGKALDAVTSTMRDRLDAALGTVATRLEGIAKEGRDDRANFAVEARNEREKLSNRVGDVEKLVAEIRGAINGLNTTVKRAIGP